MAKSVAAKVNLPAHEVMVQNILATYRSATPAQVEAGTLWYAQALEWAETLATGTPYSVAQCAGVIAALSPKQEWAINKRAALNCVQAHSRGEALPACHYPIQVDKAQRILDGALPLDVLHGPKERSFYGNIMGDASCITVDRWAFRTATGVSLGDNAGGISTSAYPILAAAWNEAARILGVSRHIVQAVCWVVERGSAQ